MSASPPSRIRRRDRIRTRVLLGIVVLLAVTLGLSVVGIRAALLARVDAGIETELAQEVEELRILSGGIDPATGEPFADDVAAIFRAFMDRNVPAADEVFYSFAPSESLYSPRDAPRAVIEDAELVARWRSSDVPRREDVETADGHARVLAVPVLGSDDAIRGTFVVAIYPAGRLAEVDDIIRSVASIVLGALVLGSLGAWVVAGRVVRPVRELTEAAAAIEVGDRTRRIEVTGRDELAVLGATFNSMLDRLDDAFRSQRAFLDDVAHELRTPITIARGHLELVEDDPVQRAETIAIATEELDRMTRYVDDLLVVAKSAQPDFLHLDLVDVGDLVADLVPRASALGARDWVAGPAPAPGEVIVLADGGRLGQALLALVTNAVQHTEDGDRIEVGAVVTPDAVRFHVADTGVGIAPGTGDDLFVRFSRSASGRSRRPEGTGLGLAIVAAIAHAHGGTVGVDGAPGEGATFHVEIPRQLPIEEDVP